TQADRRRHHVVRRPAVALRAGGQAGRRSFRRRLHSYPAVGRSCRPRLHHGPLRVARGRAGQGCRRSGPEGGRDGPRRPAGRVRGRRPAVRRPVRRLYARDRVPPGGRARGARLRGGASRRVPGDGAGRQGDGAALAARCLVRPVRRLQAQGEGVPRGGRPAGLEQEPGGRSLMDRTVLFVQLALGALGIVGVAGREPGDAFEHGTRVLLALLLTVVISRLSPKVVTKLSPWLFVGVFGLLVAVLFVGVSPEGSESKRWLDLGGFTLQPSEFMKIAVIAYLTAFFHNHLGDWHIWRPMLVI